MAQKPTTLPRWANDGAAELEEPASGVKDLGWIHGKKFPAKFANWLDNLLYQWMQYIDTPVGTGTGAGIAATGGSTSGPGLKGTGGATNGVGVLGVGTGTGGGVEGRGGGTPDATASTTGSGVVGHGGQTNGFGGEFFGKGSGKGVAATGGATGAGVIGTGGATSGAGVIGTAAAGNSNGVEGTGHGTGAGLFGTGGATGNGVTGQGTDTGYGVQGTGGNGTGNAGVVGFAGTNGVGVAGVGNGTGTGGSFTGIGGDGLIAVAASGNANGARGDGAGTGAGVKGNGGATGPGAWGVGTGGYGVIAESDTTSPAKAALRIVPQDAQPSSSPAAGDVAVVVKRPEYYDGAVWAKIDALVKAHVAADPSVSGTARANFDSFSIPANTLKVGSRVRVRAIVEVTVDTGGGLFETGISIGGVDVTSGTSFTVAAGNYVILEAEITIRTLGGTGEIASYGRQWRSQDSAEAYAIRTRTTSSASIDTTAAVVVAAWCDFVNASNTAKMGLFHVDLV